MSTRNVSYTGVACSVPVLSSVNVAFMVL